MATVTADFSKLKISVGNGADPEVFTEFCMVNMSRSFSKRANFQEDEIPDCSDVTNPADIVRQVRSLDYGFSGDGKLHQTDLATALGWVGAAAKNCQIDIGDAASGGYRISGAFLLETFEITGAFKETVTASVSFVPADTGAVTEAALS